MLLELPFRGQELDELWFLVRGGDGHLSLLGFSGPIVRGTAGRPTLRPLTPGKGRKGAALPTS
ncbi:hypothetical protein GCM10027294_09650 [Marinactinospora endophytica]